jgi:lysophospholipase L1-like esterase
MGHWILGHIGLAKPYRFERTLVVVVAVALAIVVAGATIALWARTGFVLGAQRGPVWGTPRGWYLIYLATLLALAVIGARWPKVGAMVLTLAALDIALGFGSALLYRTGLTKTAALFPKDYEEPRFEWHPLLQVRPVPSGQTTRPTPVHIDAYHLRGPERASEQLRNRIVVAIFGGSTTQDFGSPDGESWGERLEQLLGPERYVVVNHGVPSYTTAEVLVQTAFYQQPYGVPPTCAVYYLGGNDLSLAHTDNLDGGYANVHMRNQIDAFRARRLSGPFLSISPTLMLLVRFVELAVDTIRPGVVSGSVSAASDERLEAVFQRNVQSISAINRERGVKTIWVGQVMNLAELKTDRIRGWVAFVRDKDIWPMIERLNGLLHKQAKATGDVYANVPIRDFVPGDFLDEVRFSPAGSEKFAKLLAPTVVNVCR